MGLKEGFLLLVVLTTCGANLLPHTAEATDDSVQARQKRALVVTSHHSSCFPSMALVTLETGEKMTMKDLGKGNKVLAVTPDGTMVFSPVMMMMHRGRGMLVEYLKIHTEKESESLALTPEHMLYVQDTANPQPGFKFARNVQPGDHVFLVGKGPELTLSKKIVVNVTHELYEGQFAPLTLEGTVVVDGFLASSYAYVESHALAHMAFAPLRMIYTWWPEVVGAQANPDHVPMDWYPQMLGKAATNLLGHVGVKNLLIV